MATPKYASKPAAPPPEGPIEAWEPAPGMTISTVRMSRVQVIDVQFEHPEDWTEAQVTAAIVAEGLTIGPKLEWWCSDTDAIKMQSVSLGEPLEGEDARREPISLTMAPDIEEPDDEIEDEPADESDDEAAADDE